MVNLLGKKIFSFVDVAFSILSNSWQNTPTSKRSKSGGMNAKYFLIKLLTIIKIYVIIDT